MAEIRYVTEGDRDLWFRLDRHLPEVEFQRKVRDRQGYVLLEEGLPAGLLRFNLFWDSIPFCTMLYVDEDFRHKGYGRMLMERWQEDMRERGYGMVLTSTQVDEEAQHFYRKLGYRECGSLILGAEGYSQPMEMFMVKELPQGV